MYLLLLVFGGLLGLAGVALTLSGMSLRDGTFDAAILTPGIVAIAGGLLLIGLGAGVRILQRIERALASRSSPQTLPSGQGAVARQGADTGSETARIPFVPKITPDPQPAVASGEIFGAKAPDSASAPEKLAPAVIAIGPVHEAAVHGQTSAKNGNGAGGTRGLRLPTRLRPASAGERQSEPAFEALWPKGPRPARSDEPAVASAGQHPRSQQAAESHYGGETPSAPASNPESASTGISVLKSGVVNGMPYTLYSDGSIEAQLPEGTVRFGSITELRNHIEQSA